MEDRNKSIDKISEALQLLDEVAGEERGRLQGVLKDGYRHLKEVIIDTEHSLEGSLSQTKGTVYARARSARDYSIDRARFINDHAHEKPWVYVATAAVVGLLTGYIFGRNANR